MHVDDATWAMARQLAEMETRTISAIVRLAVRAYGAGRVSPATADQPKAG